MAENRFLDLHSKYLRWLVWGTFGVLLILASLYYEERTMIMDTAYQGFSILRKDAFSIQVNRFGAAFVQVFPLLSARAGFPLNITLWLYSISFVLEPLICVLILWFGVKHKRMGLVMILFLTLLVSHTFYWIQSELFQAIILLLFFFGMVMKWMPLHWKHFFVLVPLLPIILFLHPLLFIPFSFIWLFILFSKGFDKNQHYYWLLIIFLLMLVLKHTLVPTKPYDASSYKMVGGVLEHFGDFFSIKSTQNLIHYLLTDYFFILPLWGMISWFYTKNRSWKKQCLFQMFFWGYLLLINLSYARGLHQYHAESFYRILVVFLIIPLLYDLWESTAYRKILVFVIPLMIIVRLVNISQRHHVYTQRVDWHRMLLQKTEHLGAPKIALFEKDAPPEKPEISWATPFVTALISAHDNPEKTKTLLLTKENNSVFKQYQNDKTVFIGPFEAWNITDFKDPYFHFDTSASYRLINREDWE